MVTLNFAQRNNKTFNEEPTQYTNLYTKNVFQLFKLKAEVQQNHNLDSLYLCLSCFVSPFLFYSLLLWISAYEHTILGFKTKKFTCNLLLTFSYWQNVRVLCIRIRPKIKEEEYKIVGNTFYQYSCRKI